MYNTILGPAPLRARGSEETMFNGNSYTMYTDFWNVFFDDMFMALVPVFIGLVLCIILQSTWKGIWKIWKCLLAATIGLIIGTLIDLQLVCSIAGLVLYLLFSWKWARNLLFGTWKKTLITIAVVAVAIFLFWLFA